MAGSLNTVMLIGNLTRDPEVRDTQDGMKIVNLSLATNESWRDKNTGERKEKAEYHRVVIFNEGLAKVAEAYLKKGSQIFVQGQLQTRKWTDQSGNDKYSTEIVLQRFRGELTMLGGKSDGGGGPLAGTTQPKAGQGVRLTPARMPATWTTRFRSSRREEFGNDHAHFFPQTSGRTAPIWTGGGGVTGQNRACRGCSGGNQTPAKSPASSQILEIN